MGHRVVTGLICLLGLWVGSSPFRLRGVQGAEEAGATAGVSIGEIAIGLGGHYKAGCWTPVQVRLRGPAGRVAGRVEIEVADSDGVPVVFRRTAADPLTIPASGELIVDLYARFGRLRGELTARLRENERTLAERRVATSSLARCWPPEQFLVVQLGTQWNAGDGLRAAEQDPQAVTLAEVKQPDDLPTAWFGWEGVDAVFLATAETTFVEDLGEERRAALDRWLRLGGRLVWCVGRRGDVLLKDGGLLADWSPGTLVDVGNLRRTSALESYAGAAQRLELEDANRRPVGLSIAQLDDVRGRIEAPEGGLTGGDRPLVVRYPVGLGQATLVTLDMDQPPLSQWAARSRVITRIVERGRERAASAPKDQLGQVTHLGFDDLAGQLRGALDQFRGATLVAFSWVAAILIVYLALLGPGDYFLLRYLGRPHWTWFTLALLVTAFGALAYSLSARWQERRLRVNEAQVVDVDLATGITRGTGWFSIYSPRSDRFDLAARASRPESASESLLAWQGLPGKGMGGLSSTTLSTLGDDAYAIELQSGSTRLGGLPIQVGGTRSLTARWWREAKGDEVGSRLTAVSLDEQLKGDCTYTVPVTLTDWHLVFGNWLYRGDRRLEPGDTIELEEFSVTRYHDWHLTRKKVSVDHKDVSTPWDRADLDVARILEMMMFHEAAGGSGYTRLQHRYQGYLDLSDHLRTGRAILVGRGERPDAELARGDASLAEHQESQWVYYRVIYPVKIRPAAPAATRPAGN